MSAAATTPAPAASKKAPAVSKKAAEGAVKKGPKKERKGRKVRIPPRGDKSMIGPFHKKATIPETMLFRRKLQLRHRHYKLAHKRMDRKKNNMRTAIAFKRAERYMQEYLDQEKDLKLRQKEAKQKGGLYVPPQPKLAFVMRIRGILGVSPKPRKILQLFRLRQINNGVFIRLNESTKKMLTLIEPYVAWGYPDLATVRKLVYARGYIKRHKQRLPLNDNRLVEEQLGKYGLVCVEDLVHQIFTVGRYFSKVNKFLWNFKLHAPRGGWRKIRTHYCEGGDAGNREELINRLITRMI